MTSNKLLTALSVCPGEASQVLVTGSEFTGMTTVNIKLGVTAKLQQSASLNLKE